MMKSRQLTLGKGAASDKGSHMVGLPVKLPPHRLGWCGVNFVFTPPLNYSLSGANLQMNGVVLFGFCCRLVTSCAMRFMRAVCYARVMGGLPEHFQ